MISYQLSSQQALDAAIAAVKQADSQADISGFIDGSTYALSFASTPSEAASAVISELELETIELPQLDTSPSNPWLAFWVQFEASDIDEKIFDTTWQAQLTYLVTRFTSLVQGTDAFVGTGDPLLRHWNNLHSGDADTGHAKVDLSQSDIATLNKMAEDLPIKFTPLGLMELKEA